jgi:hypothetical protein
MPNVSSLREGVSTITLLMWAINLDTRLHKIKIPTLLVELSIRNIMELLKRHGFPAKFREWIYGLFVPPLRGCFRSQMGWMVPLSSTEEGLGQGELLSPLLFVHSIDPLQQILELATDQ